MSSKDVSTKIPPLTKADRERNLDLAMAAYRAEQDAVRARTARLRALRLAREARPVTSSARQTTVSKGSARRVKGPSR